MAFGERLLFENVSFGVEPGDKIGLIGANGCGKTTLFNLILGKLTPESGGIVRAAGLNIGYLQQHACRDSERTAYEEALSVFSSLIEEEKRLNELSARLSEAPSDSLIAEFTQLNEKFIAGGGLTYKSRTMAALKGLGFSETECELKVGKLSGGQRSKLELCRLLISAPELMLLDEPTNHLDIASVVWLEGYLSSFKGAAMIISHDRFFLDRVTGRTFSFENGHMYSANGNYTRFKELRALEKETERREYENTMREVKRIEEIIEQQRRWNREKNIKTAESKEKQIERLTANLKKPEPEQQAISPVFQIKSESGNDCLFCEGLSKSFGEKQLYNNASLDIKRGERVFLVGANGCGKTTLMKQLLSDNRVRFGAGVMTGYFDQHGEGVSSDKSAFGELRDSFPALGDTELRSALAAYGFKGDAVFNMIGSMSGGERAKLLFCKLGLKKANLLLLDEPTNHLDLPSREALEAALSEYRGTLLVISHDRYFIKALATRIVSLTQNGLMTVEGGAEAYFDSFSSVQAQAAESAAERESSPVSENKQKYLKRKADASRLRRLRADIRRIESDIAEREAEADEISRALSNTETAADYTEVVRLTELLNAVNGALDELTEQWALLSEELEESGEEA